MTPTRVERSVPLKGLVAQLNYNLFDMELGAQQKQFAYLQAKDLIDTVDGVLHTHDVALWNGNDTSLSAPTTLQYFGAAGQIAAGGNAATITATESIVDGIKSQIAQMVANSNFAVRPTAIYANPVLLDLIDREMKTEFNVVLNSREITGGFTVKTLSTQAGELPLIPEWALSYTRHPGFGQRVVAGVHRDGGPDRVPLAERLGSAHLPTRSSQFTGFAVRSGEVWWRGCEGRQLRACASDCAAVGHGALPKPEQCT